MSKRPVMNTQTFERALAALKKIEQSADAVLERVDSGETEAPFGALFLTMRAIRQNARDALRP